ncbi:efflux RND transporter periplasmic adaptor subunit [Salinisphaera sp. T31B1]|uniref:efflux RND transporter periplasmic adaptor subunit n=1 Tax=Salinisphaera sp. T31B1 TaxID=727963 RepID=UPI00333F85C1
MICRSSFSLFFIAVALTVAGCSDTGGQPAPPSNNQTPEKASQQGADNADKHDSEPTHDSENAAGREDHADEESPDRVHLTPAQRSRLDIKVGKAGSGSATAVVSAPATVAFDSDRVARIGPRLSAKVLKVTADLGARVEAGDTVAILDSVALGQSKAAYLTAAARYQTRLAAYQRNKKLADDKIISEATLLESRAKYSQARAEREAARGELKLYGMNEAAIDNIGSNNGAPLSRYPLTTPMAGVVQQRDLVPGQSVSANETPIHVVDNSRMWVIIEADEQSLPRLQTGLTVKLTVRPLPDQAFTGTVDWISAELDAQSRTVRVRATVDNPDGVLKTGMFGTARIQTESERQFALVPIDAVQSMGERDIVFVPGDESGAFHAVPVKLGDEGGGQVEIRQGLNANDAVVTHGSFDLASAMTAGGRSAAHSH